MNNNVITYETYGRFGNQLQLYACARTLSLRYGWKFLYKPLIHQKKLSLSGRPYHLITDALYHLGRKKIVLNDHDWDITFNIDGSMSEVYLNKQNTFFVLKWGGIFKDISQFKDILIREIFPQEILFRNQSFDKSHIAMHVRRDDTHYPMPLEYYVTAVNMAKRHAGRNVVIHLFSDGDHDQISSDLREKLSGVEIIIHKGDVVEDLTNMSKFRTIIISMSWYSYWAAFISKDAIIYAPELFCYYPHWQPVKFI